MHFRNNIAQYMYRHVPLCLLSQLANMCNTHNLLCRNNFNFIFGYILIIRREVKRKKKLRKKTVVQRRSRITRLRRALQQENMSRMKNNKNNHPPKTHNVYTKYRAAYCDSCCVPFAISIFFVLVSNAVQLTSPSLLRRCALLAVFFFCWIVTTFSLIFVCDLLWKIIQLVLKSTL